MALTDETHLTLMWQWYFQMRWSIWIVSTTGAMDHEFLDQLKELRIGIRIRKFRAKETVYILWRAKLGSRIKEDNDVKMRKTLFLKLIGVDYSNTFLKNTIFDVFDQSISFGMENTINQIWMILWPFAWQKCIFDLFPIGICSHNDKKICTLEVMIDGKGILTGSCICLVLPVKKKGRITLVPT